MKRKISIIIFIILLVNIFSSLFYNFSFANSKKRNPNSYWSTTNAPIFYGATKITLKKDLLNEFNVFDSRFRIFATDFEDGDLTQKITYSGNININEVGTYEITYKVTDSHNNKTSLVVPVIVTDDENTKINVERTLYTIPSVWNMDLAEFSRCNYGDRQILGIYLSANQSIKARVISSENNIAISFLNNDSHTESSTTLPTNGEWITLENKVNNIGFDSVPLLTSTVLSKSNTLINKTFKIELEYDEKIKPLSYYHYQDNEQEFRTKWLKSGTNFGVLESETLILVVPLKDINYMTNFYKNGFTSLDSFFDYYQKVVEKMDEYVGLDFNPVKITDQNVRTKYLIKANAHGAGAAYYAGNHVGVNNSSMASFFEMNWGGLHELAHGYQGSLGKGEMQLGEVSNNIIGHYIQTDKNIYFHPGNWLGELSSIEDERNSQRLSGKTFLDVDEPTRLYVIVNLLNSFEKGTTYGKMFSWYREQLNSRRTMTNQDAYVESIADIYNINIIPYMESWGLKISDETKSNIYQRNYPLISILKDFVDDDTLNTIMTNEDLDRKYSLVTNEVLMKYGINSNIYLNIDIDDFNKINGKFILIKDGNSTVKSIKIDNLYMEINNLPIGTYYLQMPIIEGYSQDYTYVQVIENQTLSYTHTYYKQEDVDYNNYLKLQVLGYNYDTIAYQLIFKDKYTKAEISYPNQSGMSGNEYIKIYDEKGSLVTEDISTGGYFDFNKGTHEIDLDIGYVIEINYPNKYQDKIKIFSTLSGNVLPEYSATNTITRYVVINNGLIKEDMDEDIANEIAYEQLKPSLIAIIEEYKSKVTNAELNNKFINFKEKAKVVDAYMRLKEKDQAPYTSLITAIQKGGSPIITVKSENLKYEIGTTINLYNLITATDNEDGIIIIDKNSTIIDTKFNNNVAGNYKITYKVSDSDNNISTKIIYIEIFDNSIPEEPENPVLPEIPDKEETPKPEEPDLPSDDDNNTPEEEPDLPTDDDNNTPEEEPNLPSDDDNNIPEEEPDLPPDDDNNIPEEEPDLPTDDDNNIPEKDPDLPSDDDNNIHEKEPNLPVEDTKPEIPKLPEYNTTPNVEIKPTLTNKNNNQSKIENNNNESNTETIKETSNQTLDNSLTDTLLEKSDKEVNEEEIHEKEMIHDEIDSATGPEELQYNSINKQIIFIIIITFSLICLFTLKKKRENF